MKKNFFTLSIIFLFCTQLATKGMSQTPIVSIGQNSGLKIQAPDQGAFHAAFLATSEEISSSSQLLKKIEDFERAAKKRLEFVTIQSSWLNGIYFPELEIKTIYDSGRIPILRIQPQSIDKQYTGEKDPIYDLRMIAKGYFDFRIGSMLRQAAKVRGKDGKLIPIMMVFGPEVNGYWNSYSGLHYGGGTTNQWGDPNVADGPEIFRDAYKRIISLSRRPIVNARNLTWAIHFDVQGAPVAEWNLMENYYPGDDYIDWIGLSVLGAQSKNELQWIDSFEDFVFNKTVVYDTRWEEFLAVSPNKPKALFEFGIIEDPNDPERKANWIKEAFEVVEKKCPEFKLVSYWHESFWMEDEYTDLKITSSENAERAYSEAINKQHFAPKVLID